MRQGINCIPTPPGTGVMAVSEIPPQMANFQTFFLKNLFFSVRTFFRHFAHCYFVLNFSLSAQKQHILTFRKTESAAQCTVE